MNDVFLIAVKIRWFLLSDRACRYHIVSDTGMLVNEVPKNLRIFLTLILYAPSITGGAIFIWSYIFSGRFLRSDQQPVHEDRGFAGSHQLADR